MKRIIQKGIGTVEVLGDDDDDAIRVGVYNAGEGEFVSLSVDEAREVAGWVLNESMRIERGES